MTKTMSIVRLDGVLLTEEQRLSLCASEEHLHDLVLPTPPISLPALSQVEEVEARALVERARWQARQNATLVCCDYED